MSLHTWFPNLLHLSINQSTNQFSFQMLYNLQTAVNVAGFSVGQTWNINK